MKKVLKEKMFGLDIIFLNVWKVNKNLTPPCVNHFATLKKGKFSLFLFQKNF
jgi:hypothetical protein